MSNIPKLRALISLRNCLSKEALASSRPLTFPRLARETARNRRSLDGGPEDERLLLRSWPAHADFLDNQAACAKFAHDERVNFVTINAMQTQSVTLIASGFVLSTNLFDPALQTMPCKWLQQYCYWRSRNQAHHTNFSSTLRRI